MTGAAAGAGWTRESGQPRSAVLTAALQRRDTPGVPVMSAVTALTCNALVAEKCCTHSELETCIDTSKRTFLADAKKCAHACKNKKSAACHACARETASDAVAAMKACIAKCGTVTVSSASPSSGQLLAPPVTLDSAYVALAAADHSCDSDKVDSCVLKGVTSLGVCLASAALECLTDNPECPITLSKCFVDYIASALSCDPCSGSTHCTPANVCCGSGTIGCPCGSGTSVGCCVDSAKDPHNCGRCGKACPGGQNCCNGKCVDLSSNPVNCGSCGSICAAPGKCTDGCCCAAPFTLACEGKPCYCCDPANEDCCGDSCCLLPAVCMGPNNCHIPVS
jgi:hypothetical protein